MTGSEGTRAALTAERQAILARLSGLQRELADIVAAAATSNGDDEHDPEGATIAFERQHLAALVSQATAQLAGVDAAIGRLDAGAYGTCARCGKVIPAERLTARPTATTCVRCAS